ncbi:UNVERIFIED_CONTAM: hypothetical protein Slati_0872200 [Sesamum latifolium]|uniref:Reverse transcriptase zinc-binding domain-containing protein n=1 Tax=Sesamum latifolium TaxID=2727402 RepID=A0AAW2XP32_9LAMI
MAAMLGRLSTLDRAWWNGQNRTCVLCDSGEMESHNHLLFSCDFSRQCLRVLRREVHFSLPHDDWLRNVERASRRWRGKHPLNAANRAILASIVYHILRERNSHRFSNQQSTPAQVARLCVEQIRMRLLGDDLQFNVSTASRSNMKELMYVTDRVVRTGGIHVYGVGITSSIHRLAAFLPHTCTSQYPLGNSRKRRPGSNTRVGRELHIPLTGEGWKGESRCEKGVHLPIPWPIAALLALAASRSTA